MELKYGCDTLMEQEFCSFNRTAYGIEMPEHL